MWAREEEVAATRGTAALDRCQTWTGCASARPVHGRSQPRILKKHRHVTRSHFDAFIRPKTLDPTARAPRGRSARRDTGMDHAATGQKNYRNLATVL